VANDWVQTRRESPAVWGPEAEVAQAKVVTSCAKVTGAIVSAAAGDEMKVLSYMQTVCSRHNLDESDLRLCNALGAGLVRTMKGDPEFNKAINLATFCQGFYKGALTTEAKDERSVRLGMPPRSRAVSSKASRSKAGAGKDLEVHVVKMRDLKNHAVSAAKANVTIANAPSGLKSAVKKPEKQAKLARPNSTLVAAVKTQAKGPSTKKASHSLPTEQPLARNFSDPKSIEATSFRMRPKKNSSVAASASPVAAVHTSRSTAEAGAHAQAPIIKMVVGSVPESAGQAVNLSKVIKPRPIVKMVLGSVPESAGQAVKLSQAVKSSVSVNSTNTDRLASPVAAAAFGNASAFSRKGH